MAARRAAGRAVNAPASPLTLLRLQPDMQALARWASATQQPALRDDAGYLLHGAMAAALGELAPQPFAVRRRGEHVEVVGYTCAGPEALQRALQLPPADARAAAALGLRDVAMDQLPGDWRRGERLSFEARVAPVVRSRSARPGAVVEVDAAWHPSFAQDRPGDRVHAYGQWLARELSRDGAALLQDWQLHAFALARIARRGQRAAGDSRPRGLAHGLLPDLTVRGELLVQEPAAFGALLARGLGRHRAFGYGCLLLAPAGALHRSRSC